MLLHAQACAVAWQNNSSKSNSNNDNDDNDNDNNNTTTTTTNNQQQPEYLSFRNYKEHFGMRRVDSNHHPDSISVKGCRESNPS